MIGILPTAGQTEKIAAGIDDLRECVVPAVTAVQEILGETLSDWRRARAAVVLPGSFNPLHQAHLLLLETASLAVPRAMGTPVPVKALSLSIHTVDKTQVTGMALHDRAWTMHATISPSGGVALLASHGLYLDQASALRATLPALEPNGLWFAIGHDKAVQIFDPRYYDNRDASLEALFSRAGLLVAPRAGADADDLHALMRRHENRRFSDNVRPILIPSGVSLLSSTAIRAGTAPSGIVPPAVAEMIGARRCYVDVG
jgi:nicotinic acid mononucleotide adenylyltransferase